MIDHPEILLIGCRNGFVEFSVVSLGNVSTELEVGANLIGLRVPFFRLGIL